MGHILKPCESGSQVFLESSFTLVTLGRQPQEWLSPGWRNDSLKSTRCSSKGPQFSHPGSLQLAVTPDLEDLIALFWPLPSGD